MSVTKFELKLLDDFQEKRELNLDILTEKYNVGVSTIKRSIENLNYYLLGEHKLKITRGKVLSNINYKDKIEFVQKLNIRDYSPKREERIEIILILGFFNDIVNLSSLYESLGFSLTTKKKDSRYLREILKEKKLSVNILHKKGIEIIGDESIFRIIVAQRLIDVMELDENDIIYSRKANNPIECILFNFLKIATQEVEEENRKKIQELIKNNSMNMDYASKKLLFIYYNLSVIRQKKKCFIKSSNIIDFFYLISYKIFQNKNENIYINQLMASLNYEKPMEFPKDEKVEGITDFLINKIEKNKNIFIYNRKRLFSLVYAYVYKCKLKNYLGYAFYDDKLVDTIKKYYELSNIILNNSEYLEEIYKLKLSKFQISSLTLIIETFLLDNREFSQNIKKIVIITNSSIEKINFFVKRLSYYIEFKFIKSLTIAEISKLKLLEYDCVISFSNRIATLLFKDFNIETLKVKFYFDHIDIQSLIDNGFSEKINKKINKDEFINMMIGKNKEEIKEIIDQNYDAYFQEET